ncbi:MAG: Tat pathway signal sequence, partial [Coriobacteriales bacterium]|nr:Tat pathway signal sequence [Coriobacteriales bacterium]
MAQSSLSWQDLLQQLFGIKIPVNEGGGAGGSKPRKPFKTRTKIIALVVLLLFIAGCYWYFHPPINIQSRDLWVFVIIFILLPVFLVLWTRSRQYASGVGKASLDFKKAKLFKRLAYLPIAVLLLVAIGALVSAVFFPGNAERYATVLNTQTRDFTADVHEVDYAEIPVIDRYSAALLGNRVMGSIPEYVSQFEISPLYSQINYQGHPVRVSPLLYADFFKWWANQSSGLPAYVIIDMTTQDANIVKLDTPIRYSESEPFDRNIDRYMQLKYPFYLFDQKSFEIDEDGRPWWVCPVQKRTIGLFGGTTISRVVLCDASTGECIDLDVSEVPVWVDRVYPSELLIEQYNWSGAYSDGWINSWLGQQNVIQTTPGTNGQEGYNYIAKDDDVWVYTGVTSATADNSIVGFVLINQRTAESGFYPIAGATEDSAMSSAEGQVQHLGYVSTFPLLLNINSQPTYFMALKDNAGLVKMYAMIDIQRYQNVAVSDTVLGCQEVYKTLLATNGVELPLDPAQETNEASGTIEHIAQAVIEGNSHFYLKL